MFQWSYVFTSTEPTAPGRRSSQELVTNTLMLELGALLKGTLCLRHERVKATRRRSASMDYTWLVTPCPRSSFVLSLGKLLKIQDVCAKISPSQCGPVILRTWKLVTKCEPGVGEVSRIFRSVLCDCLDRVEKEGIGVIRRSRSMPDMCPIEEMAQS